MAIFEKFKYFEDFGVRTFGKIKKTKQRSFAVITDTKYRLKSIHYRLERNVNRAASGKLWHFLYHHRKYLYIFA